MCPHGYQHNGFLATHALGHMMYGYALWVTPIYQFSSIISYRKDTPKIFQTDDNVRSWSE